MAIPPTMDQEQPRQTIPQQQAQESRQHPQHLSVTSTSSTVMSDPNPNNSKNTTTHGSIMEQQGGASTIRSDLDVKPPASVQRHHGTLAKDTGQQPPLTADQFSSSLASIASTSARQQANAQRKALHHQQSSSSSDYSSSRAEAALVTANGTTSNDSSNTNNTSSSGSNNNSSGSGEDNRESSGGGGGYNHTSFHHHASLSLPPQSLSHHGRRNKREHAATKGDDYGLPLTVADDRLTGSAHPSSASNNAAAKAPTNHHATVVARLPPPDSQSSLSSSGNEGSSTSSLLKPHRGPAYHTIKQTLQSSSKNSKNKSKKTNKSSSSSPQKSSKSKHARSAAPQDTTSSDSSGEPTTAHKRHHHHKRPAMDKEAPGSGSGKNGSNKKKKKTLKTSPSSTAMARKKQRHGSIAEDNNPSSGSNSSSPLKSSSMATRASEEDENDGSNSSSGSGTEAGYAGSASSNENLARGNGGTGSNGSSTTSNSSSSIPDFSSGASERFGTSPSNSPSISSSNGDEEDEEDDSSEDDQQNRRKKNGSDSNKKAKAQAQWPPHIRQEEEQLKPPAATESLKKKPPAPSNLMAAAQSQFAKISRTSTSSNTAVVARKPKNRRSYTNATTSASAFSKTQKPPILTLGSDLMAHVLTFLEPPDILRVLTMPLSKDWQATFAGQQELWRVLCLLEPFKAQVEEDDFSSSSSSSSSSSCCDDDDEDADDDGSLSSFSVGANGNPPPAAVWKNSSSSNHNGRSTTRSSSSSLKPAPPTKATSASSSAAPPAQSQRLPKLSKLGKYRLLYTSFVRCMKYLARMKEDVLHGRPPSIVDYGGLQASAVITSPRDTIGSNRSLQQFLAGARGVVESQQRQQRQQEQPEARHEQHEQSTAVARLEGDSASNDNPQAATNPASNAHIMSADDGSNSYESSVERRRKRKKNRDQKRRKKPKFGRSMLTDRLLGPAPSGEVNPENVALPWSCALYSIVNWMVAFADVEGIQVMCLKVLPYLLEDEQQRITAQRVGLTDVILRGMILFPDNVQLHTASFHTLVLLARPLGGREGMLFHSSMVNAAGIFSGGEARNGNGAAQAGSADDSNESGSGEQGSMFSSGPQNDGKNGIAVMLDSMRRFEADEALQAMSCWSLVNIALAPVQKEVLVKLGGIEVTTNAMMRHPHNAEVQFRALFALINLVIPSVNVSEGTGENQENGDDVNGGISEELDEAVGQITNLVVLAMKNFCSSEAILNRACLVLHNLSLTQGYHSTLLWTPNCYQMLEWCLANYRTDQVLQQSAAGTLHRLQVTLSNDENLRARFAASIQAQQQLSLEAAHREALHIYEQQEQMRQGRAGGGAE